ncbi:MAG: hypothetical protein ACQEP2_08215, partial [Actinomycetota bacterium]
KIDFTDEYFNVLEEKQIAEERIELERNVLEQERIKKEQVIIQSEAEAEQITIKGESLREYPEIIQLEFIQKLSPNINWGILPEGIVPLVDLGGLQGEIESITPETTTQIPAETETEEEQALPEEEVNQ